MRSPSGVLHGSHMSPKANGTCSTDLFLQQSKERLSGNPDTLPVEVTVSSS